MSGFDLSRRARGDLVEIGAYGAERWGDELSERYVSEFYTVFQWLVEGRSIGRRCERVRPGPCRMEHASHVVFFRRLPDGLLVSVIRSQQ